MRSRFLATLVMLGLMSTLVGCAPRWVVADDNVAASEKVHQLNQRYHGELQVLADNLTQTWVSPALGLNYVSFEEYKGEPVVAVYTQLGTTYNIQRTSKVARSVSGFSDGMPKVLDAFRISGLLEKTQGFSTIKCSVNYSTQDFSIADPLLRAFTNKTETANFFLPVGLVRQYLAQDLSVQELLAKSHVLINGEKNIIKTQETAID